MPIRPATLGDARAINLLYDHYIRHTPVTFDLEPWSTGKREDWIRSFVESGGLYHLIVLEEQGDLLGFACNRRFRDKAAYDTTTETTIYLAPGQAGNGLGSRLYSDLFERIDTRRIHCLVAGITVPNRASVRLHRRFGFTHVGTFHQVGFKFGRYHSVAWYERPAVL